MKPINYTKEDMEKDLKAFDNKREQIDSVVKSFGADWAVHQDVVIIERIDHQKLRTFLNLDSKRVAQNQRIRESWIGRVLAVSNVESFNEQIQMKKELLKKDDIITFNPEGAYSLNIDEFYEIWIISADAVILKRGDYDIKKTYEGLLKRKLNVLN